LKNAPGPPTSNGREDTGKREDGKENGKGKGNIGVRARGLGAAAARLGQSHFSGKSYIFRAEANNQNTKFLCIF